MYSLRTQLILYNVQWLNGYNHHFLLAIKYRLAYFPWISYFPLLSECPDGVTKAVYEGLLIKNRAGFQYIF